MSCTRAAPRIGMNSTRFSSVRTYLYALTALLSSVHANAEGSSRVFGSTETSTVPRTVAEQELLVPLYALVLGLTGAIVIVLLLLSIFALSAFSYQTKASATKAAASAPAAVSVSAAASAAAAVSASAVLSTMLSAPPPSASPIRQAKASTAESKDKVQSEEKEQLPSQPQYVAAVKATRKLRVSHHIGGVQMTVSASPSPSSSASLSAPVFAPTEMGMQGSKSVVSLGLAGPEQELDREFAHPTPTHRAVQRKLRVDLSGGNVRTYSVSPTRNA